MPSRRLTLAAVVVALAALSYGAPSSAQSGEDDLSDLEHQQDQVNNRLDVLQADYADLQAAVDEATTRVRQGEAAKREAEQQLEAAQNEVRAATSAVGEMRGEIGDLQVQAEDEMVEAYMNPDPTLVAMETGDLSQATRRAALLSTVTDRHADVLDQLQGLQVDLVDAERRARDARAEVEVHRAEVQRRLATYQAELAEQQRLRSALADRIDAVQAEAGDLAAEEEALRARLAQQASQAPVPPGGDPGGPIDTPPSASGLIWPAQGTITGVFGEDRGDHIHQGIDIANSIGTPIYAANSGTVLGSCGSGFGNCVLIDHGGGFVTLYAHQTSVFVSAGQHVERGQNIGTMGCTGSCTGPHLHFETRVNGVAQDPMNYLP